jgi:membrane protein implicated in regulation of membrane protease activity
MLHGAIVWLVTVPLLVALAAIGAGTLFGGWYGGLAGTPIWVTPNNVAADPGAATAARNTALLAVTALLIGLVGSVLGGWLASGEPMSVNLRSRRTNGRTAQTVRRTA